MAADCEAALTPSQKTGSSGVKGRSRVSVLKSDLPDDDPGALAGQDCADANMIPESDPGKNYPMRKFFWGDGNRLAGAPST
jgi:hypothetical protein